MTEFTMVGLVHDIVTGAVVRIVFPTEGDWELDDPLRTMFALDPTRAWAVKKVPKDSADANAASASIVGGGTFRLT